MFVGSWLHVSVYGWTQSGQQSPWAETPGHPGRVANAWALTLSIHSVCFPTNSQLEMGGFRENPSRLVWMKCPLSPFLCTWSIKFLLPDSYQFLGRWPYVGAIRDLRGPSNYIQTEISTHVFDSPTDYATCFFSRGWREWKWADSTWSKRRLLTHSCHPFVSSLIDPSITDILFLWSRWILYTVIGPIVGSGILEWTGPDLTSALHPPITWALFLHSMVLPQDVCTCSVLCLNCSSPSSS